MLSSDCGGGCDDGWGLDDDMAQALLCSEKMMATWLVAPSILRL